MKPISWGALGVVACLAGATDVAVADKKRINITTGLWEMSAKMTMMGATMDLPTAEHCITEKDLIPKIDQPGMKCKMRQKVTDSTVTWSVSCDVDGGGSMKGNGKIVYSGKAFTGSMDMTITAPQVGEQKGSMTMTGTWVGACTKK